LDNNSPSLLYLLAKCSKRRILSITLFLSRSQNSEGIEETKLSSHLHLLVVPHLSQTLSSCRNKKKRGREQQQLSLKSLSVCNKLEKGKEDKKKIKAKKRKKKRKKKYKRRTHFSLSLVSSSYFYYFDFSLIHMCPSWPLVRSTNKKEMETKQKRREEKGQKLEL